MQSRMSYGVSIHLVAFQTESKAPAWDALFHLLSAKKSTDKPKEGNVSLVLDQENRINFHLRYFLANKIRFGLFSLLLTIL